MSGWEHGDTVVIRNVARSDGAVTTATPAITIRDDVDLLAVWIPKSTAFKDNWVVPPSGRAASVRSTVPSAQRRHRDLVTENESIRLYLPGQSYSIGLTFNDDGEFLSWSGNLEAPFVRTALGIDARDFALDVVATPDGRWWWKDEEEFTRRLEIGIDLAEHQARVRAAGSDFIERFERGAWPLSDGWQNWRPPAHWQIRELPED